MRVPVAVMPWRVPGHGDGCRMGLCKGRAGPSAEGSTSVCSSPRTAMVPGRCSVAPRGGPLPAAWLQPWQRLFLQVLRFSLAPPTAPGAKHNTSLSLRLSAAPAAFCIQPPKEGSSASSQEQLGDPHPGSTPPSSAAGPLETILPRLTHVWGGHSCSLAAPQGAAVGGIHPLQRKLLLGTRLGHGRGSRSWQLLKALLAQAWPHQADAAILEQG